ncbi:MvaI/BcnI family restriction endonuclease [Paludibacterium paludis]|uniref:MvaI/BcnI restriction endonuclease domain-containing protein n=1 Tax=Paludibacterium paludis TaxID=1225769 RepID=A0A918U7L2_9NEIS|nr:MvaI/BcnI family restriction endonuclease [Paludibacterium paludis]GGY04988.1 hypothetical protein GCM10011289_04430 [Paludibacterium paludis]
MFPNLAALLDRFVSLGAISAFCKPLAENDNSKQQIYLGSSFQVVQMFRFEQIQTCREGKIDNYKAKLNFYWIDAEGKEQAKGSQLILYPQYPEVRLSGFLKGCRRAPNEHLRPTPKEARKHNNNEDGRVLFFAVTQNGLTLAFLAPAGSILAIEFLKRRESGEFENSNIFTNLPLPSRNTKSLLLGKLNQIRQHGWHESVRLDKSGNRVPYKAKNGGGYTLEALLGIIPNGRSEPDFMGWEIKAHKTSRITLMTPEPDGGMYGEQGVEAFVRRFGHSTANGTLYFTGQHKVGIRNKKTSLTLSINGYDPEKNVITDVAGAIELLTDDGECVASWSFEALLLKWNRKHTQAAYVTYESRKEAQLTAYRFLSPALAGEGTDFSKFLQALADGAIVFDPGSKVMDPEGQKSTVKARSQFRITKKMLPRLYSKFEPFEF